LCAAFLRQWHFWFWFSIGFSLLLLANNPMAVDNGKGTPLCAADCSCGATAVEFEDFHAKRLYGAVQLLERDFLSHVGGHNRYDWLTVSEADVRIARKIQSLTRAYRKDGVPLRLIAKAFSAMADRPYFVRDPSYWQSFLVVCVVRGYRASVQALLDIGVCVHTGVQSVLGWSMWFVTPLDYARDDDIRAMLLAAGAHAHPTRSRFVPAYLFLQRRVVDVAQVNQCRERWKRWHGRGGRRTWTAVSVC
jgi:hypothetical protein